MNEEKIPPASPIANQKGPQLNITEMVEKKPTVIKQPVFDKYTNEVHLHPASIPVIIDLPSKGLLYKNGIPAKVRIKEMRMREMMMLQTQALWNDNRVFVEIFENCVEGLPEGFHVLDLFTADKDAIMIALRILSFGSKYKVKVRCPKKTCSHEYDHYLDLEKDLDVKYLEEGQLEYPLTITGEYLKCGRTIKMNLLTFRDEIEIDKKADRALDEGSLVNTKLKDQFNSTIIDIQDLDISFKSAFIETLTGMDASILDQVISEPYFGVKTTYKPSACPKCGEVFTANMPLNENFFRATLPKAFSLASLSKH